MDRSGLRHAAAACIVAGGLVVGGPGVVIAAADTGGVGQHERDGSGPASDGGGVARGRKVGGGVAPGRKVGPAQETTGWRGGVLGPHPPCDQGGGGTDGGSGGGFGGPPPGRGGSSSPNHRHRRPPPWTVPGTPLQPQPGPVEPDIVSATAGPPEAPAPEAGPPVLTPPPLVVLAPPGGIAPGPRIELPRGAPGEPPEVKNEPLNSHREPMPGAVGRDVSPPASFRAGYSEYLRNAGVTQMAALALPGLGGILLLTAGGGFIGYRQAKAGHAVRTEGIARFLH